MKNIVKNTLILFAITLVAGLGLGFVYNVTSKARNDQEEKTKMTAYESVMPGMESFENVKVDSACAKYIKEQVKKNETDNNITTIKEFNCIKNDGTVLGISFLSLSETPGLGMKANEDSFKNQFKNKKADYFVYSKSGASADNEINAISSATITSNAVTHGVNAAIYCVKYITGGGK